MKKMVSRGIIGLMMFMLGAQASYADTLSVALDMPVVFSPSEDVDASMPQGIKAGISFIVIPIGLGVEYYTVDFGQNDGVDFSSQFTILDLYFNLPIPVVNIAAGVGLGMITTGDASVGGGTLAVEPTGLTQYFVSVGYDILPLVDLHVGYHSITAYKTKTTYTLGSSEVTSNADFSGNMISIGTKIGF
ncbi:MAG: hypothetical protein HQM12_11100 [SAR324 cluster bacterium]|nr:hypothetical protein [SAR324 cluster bacterium]